MALTMTTEGAKISAIVYLADGQECRFVQLDKNGTVDDIVERMLQVQEDWDDGRSIKIRAGGDSSTDSDKDHYAIVEVRTPANGGVPTERIIPRTTKLDSKEMVHLRNEWTRITFLHLRARFSKAFSLSDRILQQQQQQQQQQNQGRRGTFSSSSSVSKKQQAAQQKMEKSGMVKSSKYSKVASKKGGKGEFWFVDQFAPDTTRDSFRIKFVNTDDYQIVKGKEGWLDVKHKGVVKNRWVVLKENQLFWYKDSDDTANPIGSLADVSTCEFEMKPGKKDVVSVKLKRGKDKVKLICENDVMADKWYDALRQGRSGAIDRRGTMSSGAAGGRVLRLRAGIVEDIPEYTEEDEERDIRNALALQAQMKKMMTDQYISVDQASKPQTDTYLNADELNSLLVNSQGEYLTMETIRELAQEAGYLTVDEMRRQAGKPPADTYLDVDEARKRDGGKYLDVEDMRAGGGGGAADSYLNVVELGMRGKDGGKDAYLSVDESMRKPDGGSYLTVDESMRKQNTGSYLTVDEVRPSSEATYLTVQEMSRLVNKQGEYLTVTEMQRLAKDAGYLSAAELRTMVNDSGYMTTADMQALARS